MAQRLNGEWSDSEGNILSPLPNPSKIANNCVTTEAGYVLDARQGKALKEGIDAVNQNLTSILSGLYPSKSDSHTKSMNYYVDTTYFDFTPTEDTLVFLRASLDFPSGTGGKEYGVITVQLKDVGLIAHSSTTVFTNGWGKCSANINTAYWAKKGVTYSIVGTQTVGDPNLRSLIMRIGSNVDWIKK